MSNAFGPQYVRFAGAVLTSSLLLFAAACGSKSSSTSTSQSSSPPTTLAPTTPVSVPAWTPLVQATDLMADEPAPKVVLYGSDPSQSLEVFQSAGDGQGTIVYIHGGAWEGGSMQQNTSAIMQAQEERERTAEFVQLSKLASNGILNRLKPQLSSGWDIVSINYRLATATSGPGVRATQLMHDVDRAMRYIVANAAGLDLNMSTFVISGGSAGGHLVLMEALTASSGQFMDPELPSDLKKVKLSFDGVIAMVAPTDLNTLYLVGGPLAPPGQEALLGCSLQNPPYTKGMPQCNATIANQFSPITYTKAAKANGVKLQPAYFAFGGSDTLVLISTQGMPEINAWAAASGPNETWYDLPPKGTHNIDDNVNDLALNNWLDNVVSATWTGPNAKTPTN
ncbi:MAG: alpha/beta hydrolase [Acidimicrobiales bacterium]